MVKWLSGSSIEEDIKDYDSGKVFHFLCFVLKRACPDSYTPRLKRILSYLGPTDLVSSPSELLDS